MENFNKQLAEAFSTIKNKISKNYEVGVILGSGLGFFAKQIQVETEIPYEEIPNFPKSTVEGHSGKFVFGKVNGKQIVAMSGRNHFYEGYSIKQVVFGLKLMEKVGIKNLIVTNAAGGLNPRFKPGNLMIIDDCINFTFRNPLIGKNDEKEGPRFPDMSQPYSQELIKIAEEVSLETRVPTKKGVYLALTGPTYETASEVKMLQILGADAVGMSTVPETITCSHLGIKVLGISCITNLGTGISPHKLSHSEVSETANSVSENFSKLVTEIIGKI
ncbi:MAG: purine-nucleoside phosphorylase [Calditrichaeota bacterium]|nr:MAG: purine-nucleoside phosphorylase [Calditrichota bacterium]